MRSYRGVTFWLLVFGTSVHAEEPLWQVGLAKEVITPTTDVWLAGYGSKRSPDGKLHDLWMKTMVLQDQHGERVVLITSDFQGVPKSMSDPVFAALKKQYHLERRQVMFSFSHNHCGPRLGDDLIDYYPVDPKQEETVAAYTREMIDKTIEMVGRAIQALAPARVWTGSGKAGFAVNRRNNREADVPKLLAAGTPLKGPVDHTVPVLTVRRPDDSLVAILFGYACHPTTLSFTKWCGDYPGFAQLNLEKNHPGATAMFVNTCGGDQNPLPRRTVELCEKYGRMLSDGVEAALKGKMTPIAPELKSAFSYVNLPYERVMTRKDLEDAKKQGNPLRTRWAERMLKKLDAGETFAKAYPYPVHVWRLGKETLFIGTGAETVVDYALRFKGEYGAKTWVLGYTDDMISYIPSRRVWDEGGYEGGSNLYEYGRPALRWAGDIETRIAGKVDELVKQVK